MDEPVRCTAYQWKFTNLLVRPTYIHTSGQRRHRPINTDEQVCACATYYCCNMAFETVQSATGYRYIVGDQAFVRYSTRKDVKYLKCDFEDCRPTARAIIKNDQLTLTKRHNDSFNRRIHFYLTFPSLGISSPWSLLAVSITCHFHVVVIIRRFSYSAFRSPVQTLYSTFLLLGVSRLPFL